MSPGRQPPISRRDRPAKPALTRQGIVDTALRVLRAECLERVTMRRLAHELDTGAASLYVYVRDTAELHALILDELLDDVDLTVVSAAGSWRERLVAVLWSYTRVLIDHSGLASSALVTRPSGPGYLHLLERVLALLDEGGLAPGRSAWAADLLLHFATSTAVEQGARNRAIDADEDERSAAASRQLPPDALPHIVALNAELFSEAGAERLTWGFHVLINGVVETPRPESR
jgi:AcrR family transcriptional regulator